jgi:hypothetical protein
MSGVDALRLYSSHMRPEAIFGPVSVLALWTGGLLLLTGFRRIRAVRAGRVTRNAFRLGESPEVPDDVAVSNRNLMNLLEMPMLFYVVCLAFYVTRNVRSGVVTAAWIYVALRLIHSWIHLTSNRVLHRLIVFALSNFVLLAIWISFIRRVF